MATNQYFQNYSHKNEQNLFDNLVIEMIKMFGIDVYYVNRTLDDVDEIMNEDKTSIFNRAFCFEVFVKENMGFQGDGDFMSKFGLQIRDQMTFSVAIRTFEQNVKSKALDLVRPREGDLIFFPMNQKFFEISFVEHESVFYQTGQLNVYDLKCELFEYSNERFETGYDFIDNIFTPYKTDDVDNLEELNDVDPIAKNIFYQEKSDEFVDFSEINPFEETITYPKDS
jgi:hypothetical protein